MSGVASATLWITEQLPPWVILVQAIAFAVSFGTRRRPPAFRSDPVWLNVFMLGITIVTIRSALAGNPATISLAYFTALAQGLQLLDARPRKSEFVLVALSLFQVVLASNLTDSVLFPPLLLVFLATVTWTLLVHTILMEATEAGDPAAGQAALAPDLRRMTVVATGAALALTLVLFVLLPRLDTNMMRGGGMGRSLALSGFSDRVSLGTVGEIRKDHSVVMRVQGLDDGLPAPGERYWRGLAFDHFDGAEWSISGAERMADRQPINGIGRFGIELFEPGSDRRLPAQRIVREPVKAGVLFTPGRVQRIEGPFQNLEQDRNDGLYLPASDDERVRYTIWGMPSERDRLRLEGDRARVPLEASPGGPRPAMRYLQLPRLDPRIAALAEAIVHDAPSDFARARAIRDTLRETGRYTDAPPPLGDDATSPIEAFLMGELEGHCEYFASAMVVLARSAGLPARLVNGFAGGVPNEVGGFVEVSRADAHAWVEIHFERAGWVRFDPTPPSLRLRSAEALSLWARLSQIGSAVELWWFQRVVDFDSADQIRALRSAWRRWRDRDAAKEQDADRQTRSTPFAQPWRQLDPTLLAVGVFCLLGLALAWWRRSDDGLAGVPVAYRRAQAILARAGWRRAPEMGARGFLDSLSERLPPEGLEAFRVITEHYLAERFGGRAPRDLSHELRTLENAVDRMRLRNQPDVRQPRLRAT
jgi:hypothetical protein